MEDPLWVRCLCVRAYVCVCVFVYTYVFVCVFVWVCTVQGAGPDCLSTLSIQPTHQPASEVSVHVCVCLCACVLTCIYACESVYSKLVHHISHLTLSHLICSTPSPLFPV